MSELKSWNDFCEKMEHELQDCPIDLQTSAYRVDDSKNKPHGIRSHCGIKNPSDNSSIKTCDYFYIKDKKFLCIEFSDLLNQQKMRDDSIQELKNVLKNSQIIRSEKKNIINRSKSGVIITNELAQKITDTDFILREIYSEKYDHLICDLPNITDFTKHFLVVYFIPNFDEVDDARFADSQQDNLLDKEAERLKHKLGTTQFTFIHIDKIHWLNINLFQKYYC